MDGLAQFLSLRVQPHIDLAVVAQDAGHLDRPPQLRPKFAARRQLDGLRSVVPKNTLRYVSKFLYIKSLKRMSVATPVLPHHHPVNLAANVEDCQIEELVGARVDDERPCVIAERRLNEPHDHVHLYQVSIVTIAMYTCEDPMRTTNDWRTSFA